MKRISGKIVSIIIICCVVFLDVCPVDASIKTYRLDNVKVRNFLNEVTYDNEDYTYTKIEDYTTVKADRLDRPKYVKISFKKTKKKVTYKVATNKSLTKNVFSAKISGKKGYAKVYNLTPNQTYYYKVWNSKKKVIKSGKFKTAKSVRMCYVNGVYNVRDLGGWKTTTGKMIRYGLLYRGGEMDREHHITNNGIARMKKELKIRVDIDFRNENELQKDPEHPIVSSPLGNAVLYKNYPIISYHLDDNNDEVMKRLFTTIFNSVKENKPVYFHCAVGCDRTGTVAFLLEGLLGVDESNLAKDFELSSFYLPRPRNSEKYHYTKLIDYVKQLEGETLQEKIETYFYSLGFEKEELDLFRSVMLQ